MRKLSALLFLFGLLTILFGSIVVSGAHKLVHCISEPEAVMESAKAHVHPHPHPHAHDHGHGQHTHGATLTVLLKSFDYQQMTSLLQDVGYALQWIFQLPGIVTDYNASLEHNPPTELGKSSIYFVGFHSSASLDIPTPPPKVTLS